MTDHDHGRGGIDAAEEAAGIDPAEMTQIGRAHV